MDTSLATAAYDRAGRHQTVYLSGALDGGSAQALTDDILRHILASDDVLWVDLSEVTACDAAGADLLVRLVERTRSLNVQMRLYDPPSTVMRTLEDHDLVDQFAVWSVTNS